MLGWRLDNYKGYQQIEENPQGWLWCESLKLWFGTWHGNIESDDTVWLRFYDESGNLVLLPEEAEKQRADAQQQRADAARQARLKAVGDECRASCSDSIANGRRGAADE